MLWNGWHSERKLLASGNAVSHWDGHRQRKEDVSAAASPQPMATVLSPVP